MEKKSFLVTEVLCLLLGWLGVHRYYTGYIGLGIAQTLTLGGCGIWALIDFIFISIGKYKDANGQELEDYDKNIGIGALILILILTLIVNFGPKPKSFSNTMINNISTGTNSQIERKVKFDNASCTITSNSYSCFGNLSENDKLKIREIQAELK